MHLLLFQRGIDDDADGEEVIDSLEGTLLLLHLLPDAVDGLGAPLDVELQTRLRQSLADGLDKALDISITTLLGGTELVLDVIVGIVLKILQRQVLQLAFQLVKTQFVSQGSIEIGCLLADLHLLAMNSRRDIAYLSHQIDTVGYHDQDDTHVLCK